MPKLNFKSYMIRHLPATDWKRFVKWRVMNDYKNLDEAFLDIIKQIGKGEITTRKEQKEA